MANKRSRRGGGFRKSVRIANRKGQTLNYQSLEPRQLLATFTVTSNSDSGAGSLRNMISLANGTVGADEIVFAPATNGIEFDLSSTSISIAGSLTITGNGAATTIIDAQQFSQIFDITNTAVNVTISNVTLKNGRATGSGGSTEGGAIQSRLTGTLTINQSTLSGNTTTGTSVDGGAIYSATGAVVINQSTLSGNSTAGATSSGGAIASNSASISVNGSTISGNSTTGVTGYGGAIASSTGAITVTNSTLSGNFTTNTGAAGGAIASSSGTVTIRNSTLSGNSTAGANAYGGAIGTSSGAIVISQSTFSGNSTAGATAHGGAIATFSGPVTVSQSTISGNQVTAPNTDGGGLWFNDSLVTIVNSTITNNSATGSGGGLGIVLDGTHQKLTIRNSIIAANTGSNSNPDFTSPLDPVTNLEVRYSLIGRSNGTSLTPTGTIPDGAGNLIGGATVGTALNPLLGTLANNGGSTQTHALLINSPAFNRGDNGLADDVTQPGSPPLTTDQRGSGHIRIQFGVVDMGAFESAVLDSPEGTTGDDAFVLSYSSTTAGTVLVTVSHGGGPTFFLGTFPMNSPLTINGLGGTDSVGIFGSTVADTFIVNSSNSLTVNGAGLTLTSIETRPLAGRAGNDVYRFDADAALGTWTLDELSSGGGADVVDLSPTTNLAVTLKLGLATTQVVNANLSLILGATNHFENAIGGSLGDTLIGNGLANTLTGGAGNDVLNGNGGNDILLGGLNDDAYVFVVPTTAEADQVEEYLNQGTDTLYFTTLTTSVVLNLGTVQVQPVHANRTLKLNSATNFENAVGGAGADTLAGNGLANRLTGGAGNDVLNGNGGNDILLGGLNDDAYVFTVPTAAEADQVEEYLNQGTDTLYFTTLTTSVVLNLGTVQVQPVHANRTLKLNSSTNFENAVGGSEADTLTGNPGNNRLTGGEGNNILVGLDGNDVLIGAAGRDLLIGGLGLDTINGGGGDDILIAGRTTSDTSPTSLNTLRTEWVSANPYATRITNLRAGVGNPLVSLQAGVNVLNDAGEDDNLTGGLGSDWYFRAVDDVISDLFAGEIVDLL